MKLKYTKTLNPLTNITENTQKIKKSPKSRPPPLFFALIFLFNPKILVFSQPNSCFLLLSSFLIQKFWYLVSPTHALSSTAPTTPMFFHSHHSAKTLIQIRKMNKHIYISKPNKNKKKAQMQFNLNSKSNTNNKPKP